MFMTSYSPLPRSWAVKTPSHSPYRHNFSSSEIMGSEDSVTWPLGRTFSFPEIMGCQYSVTGAYCLLQYTLFHCDHGQSRGRTFFWPHTLFNCDQGQSRIRHQAIWPLIFLPSPRSWAVMTLHMGHMATISHLPRSWVVKTPLPVRIVYGDTRSSPEIMGCQYSVTGAYCL
ncbi:hypothetical protein Bpfe_002337 [Biomphalaria pfeifferi]|uniref:Uncharacterized protein n=1 Tax=Biomphalaria pfeifferi TaxID=112525 RepID=A0AAD8FKK1_BIOPF|nr:hypothetical protein Bpfe_002337 [Biomphalaria pfeifferi]